MAIGRRGRGLMGPLLAINFVAYSIILGLAGWSIDKYINGEQNHPHLGGNPSTSFMLTFALIGGVIGACSVVGGLLHFRVISWATTALAFGVVCKEIIMGGHRGKRLQTLEAFIALSTLTQFMYLLLLHVGVFSS